MVYFDNAATTIQKPQEVIDAVVNAMTTMGNAGRGSNDASLSAARVIYDTREALANLFHAEHAKNIAFTSNATESLNIAVKGLLNPGDHVITTMLEHNSVLRPLYEMEEAGVELTIIKSDLQGNIKLDDIRESIKDRTKMIICTNGSNLTGNYVPVGAIGKIARDRKLLFVVDASQTAGAFPIDVQQMGIDVLGFTGHKSLLGPQGTGGIYVRDGVMISPLKTGGSGNKTFQKKHPVEMPTALEAGTLNGHGIAGLLAGVNYINEIGMDVIREKEQQLMWKFYSELKKLDHVKIYGDFSTKQRCPIISFNIGDYDSADVSDELLMEYGICTRAGGHCAPLMHEALGTIEQGAVRFSFGFHNTEEEVDYAVNALKKMIEE